MAKRKFRVTINGNQFTRGSETKNYTHVVVGIMSEAVARAAAFGWTDEEQKKAEKSFLKYATGAERAAGLEKWIESIKQGKSRGFASNQERGLYEWHPLRWSGSEDAAQKYAQTERNSGYYHAVRVLEEGSAVSIYRGVCGAFIVEPSTTE